MRSTLKRRKAHGGAFYAITTHRTNTLQEQRTRNGYQALNPIPLKGMKIGATRNVTNYDDMKKRNDDEQNRKRKNPGPRPKRTLGRPEKRPIKPEWDKGKGTAMLVKHRADPCQPPRETRTWVTR